MHGTNNTDCCDIKVQSVSEHGEKDRGPNISNNITLTGSTMEEDVHDLMQAAGRLCESQRAHPTLES